MVDHYDIFIWFPSALISDVKSKKDARRIAAETKVAMASEYSLVSPPSFTVAYRMAKNGGVFKLSNGFTAQQLGNHWEYTENKRANGRCY